MLTQQFFNGNAKTSNEALRAGKLHRSSHQVFKSVFDHSPIPMWLAAKDDLSIIDVNKAALNQYGYLVLDLQQMTIQGMAVEDVPGEQSIHAQQVVKYIKRGGEVIYVKMIFQDIEIKDRPVMLVSAIEVTDEFTIRASLHHAIASLQSVLQISDIGYALFDTGLSVFSFNSNAAALAFHKYNIMLEKGASLTDCFPVEKFPRLINSAIEALGGSSIQYEIGHERSTESTLWYEIRLSPVRDHNGNITGIMITTNDITARKNAQKALCSAYNRIKDHHENMQTIAWRQSHLIRQPLANLRGLLSMLAESPSDEQILAYIQREFEKMDTVVIEMTNDVLNLT